MGRRWSGVLARLGTPTGDRRIIPPGALTSRDLPLPLLWQEETSEGHGGSRVVGRIESVEFGQGMVSATGSLLDDIPYAVWEQLDAGVIGPSVDLDDLDYVMDDEERLVITQGRVVGATLVAIPAFADVYIRLDPEPAEPVNAAPESSLWASVAVRTRVLPDLAAFRRPDVDRLTPLTVTNADEQGRRRVFGHIAPWGECHVGLPGCVTAPSSPSGYAYFLQGDQPCSDGTGVPVGTITLGGGHADGKLGWRPAQQHYDDVGTAFAKVNAGEDEWGIWVAGWVPPGVSDEALQAFVSSPVSGDWRRIGGSLEMIAVCSVNAGGFPVPRARVSFSLEDGQRSLIASFGITPQKGPARPEAPLRELRLASPSAAVSRARWEWFKANEQIKTEGK